MSYPFTNQHYAQDSYAHNAYHNGNQGRYSQEQNQNVNQYNSYESDNYARDTQTNVHDQSSLGPEVPEKSEKMYNEGNSPYGARGAASDPIYTGNSIWSHDDKRSMAKRSVPAKLFRVLFCIIINAIIVIVSIICLVVIFARPFNVGVGTVTPPSSNSVSLDGNAITFNGSIDFIVSNPNSISSALSLDAKVYDTVDKSQDIGRGSVESAKIDANANSTIHFPYQIRYDYTADKNKLILQDLLSKCTSKSQLDLELKINANIKILSVPVPVSFSQDINFDCPIPSDILKNIGGGSLGSLASSLTGRSRIPDDHHEL